MKKCGIYKITNPTGRIYIGQSKDILYRWKQYKYFYKKFNKSLIQKSIKKYGIENHTFEIIEECNEELLNIKEVYWIDFYKSNIKKYRQSRGLNYTDGGDTPPKNFGRKLKEESLKAISEKNKQNHLLKRIDNIHQYSLAGDLIKVWKKEDFSNKSIYKYHNVIKCCKKEVLIYKNCVWRFEDDEFNLLKKEKKEKLKKRKLTREEKSRIYANINKGRKASEETKKKMSESSKKRWTNERKLAASLKFKGRKAEWKKVPQTKELVELRVSKIRKSILQYDLEGNFIKEWPSAASVEKELGWSADLVSKAARNIIKKFKGYIWKYKIVGLIQKESA